jgi:hypothetical protein
MRENFSVAVGFVLKHEGGYVNDPDDPGGETKFGIAKRYHPDVDIKALDERAAADIYLNEYWLPTCDILSFPKDLIFFDTAVNMGRKAANELLSTTQTWEEMLFRRMRGYTQKVVDEPRKMKYIFGWMRRCLELYQMIKDEQKGRA